MAGEPENAEKQRAEKRPEMATESAGQINEIARAVKLMEDKYSNLRRKVQISDENYLSQQKKVGDDIRVMQSDILEIKRAIEDIKEKMRLIVKELRSTAKEEDVKVVQKYLDLWEPVQFVTRTEARKMIDKAVDEKFR